MVIAGAAEAAGATGGWPRAPRRPQGGKIQLFKKAVSEQRRGKSKEVVAAAGGRGEATGRPRGGHGEAAGGRRWGWESEQRRGQSASFT